MKTAIIVSNRGFPVFRRDLLVDPEQVRLIGIFSTLEAANVTFDCLDRTFFVPCGLSEPSPMLYSLVDADAARAAIKEVLTDTDPRELSLHCFDEQNMIVAAELREHFGIRGPKLADILPYRDKLVMKQRLAGTGVRIPRYGFFDRATVSFGQIVDEVGLPFILKPTDSAGAEGVYKVSSPEDFEMLPSDLGRAYEYEEFITGTMYSVNLLSHNGNTVFGGVTEYLVNSFDVQSGRVNADINLIDTDPRVPRMVAFAETVLNALGRLDGATHLELFHTPSDELVFLEVAARFKGLAGLSAMQRNYGVAFVNEALRIEAGIDSVPYDLEPVYCFDGVIPKRSGVIECLVEPRLESTVDMTWKIQVGETVGQTNSLLANGGTFLVSNRDYDALYRDFKRLASYEPIVYRQESRVLAIPAAAPETALSYFHATKLACETDPFDVVNDMRSGVGGFVVADARKPEVFAEEHVADAVNIPHQSLTPSVAASLDPSLVYVTYGWGPACNGGSRLAAKLAASGLRVKEMIGGLEYWKRHGYPTHGTKV